MKAPASTTGITPRLTDEPGKVAFSLGIGLLLCLIMAATMGSAPAYPLALLFMAMMAYFHGSACRHRGDQQAPPLTKGAFPRQREPDPPREEGESPSPTRLPSEYTSITFHNSLERRFATPTTHRLVMGNGTIRGDLRMELHPEQQPGNTMDTVVCTLRLADTFGKSWECRLLMLPYLLTDPIEPGAKLPSSGFVFHSEAPPDWQESLRDNCLVAGVRNLLDTRDMGELLIGGASYRLFFKQQRPMIDVAYLPSSASFIVRISGLIHDIDFQGDFSGSRILPPFCYAVPTEDLLFFTAQHHYYSYYEEWYAMEEGIGKKAPLFSGLRHRDTPQSLVSLSS